MGNWLSKMVSAIERCPLYLSAIKRFFYETMTVISSVLMNSVRYREVSAIKHVRYREVPLYYFWGDLNLRVLNSRSPSGHI